MPIRKQQDTTVPHQWPKTMAREVYTDSNVYRNNLRFCTANKMASLSKGGRREAEHFPGENLKNM